MSQKFINPSGFIENLPPVQRIEDDLKATFTAGAERFGYVKIETAAVEYMDTLSSEGNVSKEIYRIGRAQAEDGALEAERGLHFDLTIPFARYVAQNYNELSFPFRRFQIQKVWRGERPQKGRFREFYQADVDVVANEVLPIDFDAEVATLMGGILNSFNIGQVTMHISNRKFLSGLLEVAGISMTTSVLQTIDKLDKVGAAEVGRLLAIELGVDVRAVTSLFETVGKIIPAAEVSMFLTSFPNNNELLNEGITELTELFNALPTSGEYQNVAFVLNTGIARGLDYYTGTVYETTINGLERYGSICSGGRYADLASRFTTKKLPGVGMSIGLSRLLAIITEEKLLDLTPRSKTDVVTCLLTDEARAVTSTASDYLRTQGLNVEMNKRSSVGLGKQLEAVLTKGIGLALVCEADGTFTLYTMDEQKHSFTTLGDVMTFITLRLNNKQ